MKRSHWTKDSAIAHLVHRRCILLTEASWGRSIGCNLVLGILSAMPFLGALPVQQRQPLAMSRLSTNLLRSIKQEPADLRFWPLQGQLRIAGYPDAAYRNNSDSSSQRGQAIFLAEPRKKHQNSKGSLVEFESHKINRTTLSTTVSELYSLMKCFGTC